MKAENYLFALFGRHISGYNFLLQLREKGFPKPVVIVGHDDDYLRDKRLLAKQGLFADFESLESKGYIHLYKIDNVNSDECKEVLSKHSCNIAFSSACRNIIKRPLIEFFKGEIFNLHDSYLPNERGGALNSWRILNGINSAGDTIHYLDEGIDTGPIVVQRETEILKSHPKPIDYHLAEVENCRILTEEFLNLILKGENIQACPQNHNRSLYFPRLFTEFNGIIDWDWDVVSIERFVRAFGDPYPGAFSFYREKKVHILDAEIDEALGDVFHPLCNGKIVTLMDNGSVRVIAGGKALLINAISVEGNEVEPARYLNIKYSFVSPVEMILASKVHVPTTSEMAREEKPVAGGLSKREVDCD